MHHDLRTILARDNPWLSHPAGLHPWLESHLPRPFIPRHVVESNDRRWRESNRAHLVVGPRQAGKSTSIWAHLAKIGEPVLFIDCEQALIQEWCRSAPLFLAELETEVGRRATLFFEEAQHLENAGLFIKGLVDRNVHTPILVTGSSSFHLGARVRESLAGRATRSRVLPLAFSEVVSDLGDQSPLVLSQEVESRLGRHVAVGGYPEVWLSDEPNLLLTDLVEAFILRDASDLFRIKRPDAFRRLLRLVAGQTGQLVNLAEWAAILGVNRDTVASYLEILETSHVIAVLSPFVGGKRSELTKARKVFFVDNGIRHQLVNDLRPLDERTDAGTALESWVFSELWKVLSPNADLHFWRSTSKAEVDFVLVHGKSIIGVEVKSGRPGRATLPRAARSFIDAYSPEAFFMVNRGVVENKILGTTEVRWIAPQDLELSIREVLR